MKRFKRAAIVASPALGMVVVKLWPFIDRIAHTFGVCLGG